MNTEEYIKQLLTDGYTILPNIISRETINNLRQYLLNNLDTIEETDYNYYSGHKQQRLPINKQDIPWVILENEQIHQIVKGVLGSGYHLSSYTCNTNLAKQFQPFHMDCSHFHNKNVRMIVGVGPPHEIIVNIYLQDTSEHNGSLDIIPKSHLIPDAELGEDGEILSEYLKNMRSVRLNGHAGDVILRDKRTWHRGTKNKTEEPRFMIGIRYNSKWIKGRAMKFNIDSQEDFYQMPFSIENIKFE